MERYIKYEKIVFDMLNSELYDSQIFQIKRNVILSRNARRRGDVKLLLLLPRHSVISIFANAFRLYNG